MLVVLLAPEKVNGGLLRVWMVLQLTSTVPPDYRSGPLQALCVGTRLHSLLRACTGDD